VGRAAGAATAGSGGRALRRLRNRSDLHRASVGGGSEADQRDDQVRVVAGLLGLLALEKHLDPVDGRQNEGDGLAGDRGAVAEVAHQGFGRMGERFQPRQAEEAAGPLDGVDEPKNVVENLGVVGIMLETNELDTYDVDAFIRLGQEVPQQLVHGQTLSTQRAGTDLPAHFGNETHCVGKGFNFGCGKPLSRAH
jgi:hypothetical protein